MKEGLDCAGAEELCKQQHSQLPLRYMIDLQCCVGRKGEGEGGGGRRWRDVEREGGRGEVEGCGGRRKEGEGGGGGMWREREGGGGRWRKWGRWRDAEGGGGMQREEEGGGGRGREDVEGGGGMWRERGKLEEQQLRTIQFYSPMYTSKSMTPCSSSGSETQSMPVDREDNGTHYAHRPTSQ